MLQYNNLQCFKVSQITQWGKICPCNFWPNIKHYAVIILTIEQRTRLCHSILFRILWQSIWLTLWFGTNFVMQWSKLSDWTWQCFLLTLVFHLRKIWKNKYCTVCHLLFSLYASMEDTYWRVMLTHAFVEHHLVLFLHKHSRQKLQCHHRCKNTKRSWHLMPQIRSISLIARKRLLSFDLNFVAREMVDLYDQSNKSYDISLMLIYYIYQEWFLLIVTETYC